MRWEYKADVFQFADTVVLAERLSASGADGWELVYFKEIEGEGISDPSIANCIFKRCAPAAIAPVVIGDIVSSLPASELEARLVHGASRAIKVVDTTQIVIEEWREFVRVELEAITGQRWQVAAIQSDSLYSSGDDVSFVCYWDGHNVRMPPLSFSRLASGDAREELKERVQQVAKARALL